MEDILPKTEPESYREQAMVVLGMAQWRLQKPNEARAMLGKARGSLRSKWPVSKSDWGGKWYDLIVADALMREAESLIQGEAKITTETK